ncbi:glycosyltransferase family 2 protein [Chitinophaga sp. ARDCPP14]|uniref:glycosyltransferase family 2 protein n=1 Tax=Chitinophaga sp. ARDCPP14 TaxID=3391139 RepID=UPI003F51FBD4
MLENELVKQRALSEYGPWKISFCIICMNRLYHLKETLLKNLTNNTGYPGLEVLLLDYNSGDDMEQWVKNNLSDHIERGALVYYKTFDPLEFNHSHAKNMAFKLASGDIVCNINADNFTGNRFVYYIDEVFRTNKKVFMRPLGLHPGVAGVVCVNKADFLQVGGFDERMSVYGWEDVDFRNRLRLAGVEEWKIREKFYLDAIGHEEKYDRQKLLSRIKAAYVSEANPVNAVTTKVLILFEDYRFKYGTVINNKRKGEQFEYLFDLEENYWTEGCWQKEGGDLKLQDEARDVVYDATIFDGCNIRLPDNNAGSVLLYHVTDEYVLNMISYFEMDYRNRTIMINNMERKAVAVNNGMFGQGRVFRNFNYEMKIDME